MRPSLLLGSVSILLLLMSLIVLALLVRESREAADQKECSPIVSVLPAY